MTGATSSSSRPRTGIKGRYAVARVAAIAFAFAFLAVPHDELRFRSSRELARQLKTAPRRAADLFPAAKWREAVRLANAGWSELDPRTREHLRKPQGRPIPHDLDLLRRASFIGMTVAEVRDVLGAPHYDSGQPFGPLTWYMPPPSGHPCVSHSLYFVLEPDDDFVRHVSEERIVDGPFGCRPHGAVAAPVSEPRPRITLQERVARWRSS